MPPDRRPHARRYIDTVVAAIEADLGLTLPPGTTLVPAADRAGSRIATCYPFDGRSAVWCDPDIVDRLSSIAGPAPLAAEDFVTTCVGLGAEVRGIGVNRVLDGPLLDPQIDLGSVTLRQLDPEDASDVALIAELRAAVSDDDAEEADLDLDKLDPHSVAAIDCTGGRARLLAYASARPGEAVPFDDIGIVTHPEARRRGLGLACVHRLIEVLEPSGAPAMYRCEAENIGSGRIAERLGFHIVQVIGSVRFGS